jgi:hypothetical protein
VTAERFLPPELQDLKDLHDHLVAVVDNGSHQAALRPLGTRVFTRSLPAAIDTSVLPRVQPVSPTLNRCCTYVRLARRRSYMSSLSFRLIPPPAWQPGLDVHSSYPS